MSHISNYEVAQLFGNKGLFLILLPTEKCNFRCSYCYEDFSVGRMKRQTINAVKNFLARRASGLEHIYVSWFGGEPLLAIDIIEEISEHIIELAHVNQKMTYKSSMTTNGFLLTRETLDHLVEIGISNFQISLDGPPEVHDKTRIQANGQGSFNTIWNNLLQLRNSKKTFTIILRMHFDANTYFYAKDLVKMVNEAFAGDERFRCFFKPISRLGGKNDNAISVFSGGSYEELVRLCQLPMEKPSGFCYASSPASFVIRADGRVGKCTVALNDRRNIVGTLNVDGTFDFEQEKFQKWIRGIQTFDRNTLSCPLRGLDITELRKA